MIVPLIPLLSALMAAALAAVPFQLPADEDAQAWDRPLDLGGFSVGYAGGGGVWARVVPQADGTWVVEVRDANGELRRTPPQERPDSAAEREKLAALAHSLTRPDGSLPPLRVAPAKPKSTPKPTPPTPPSPPVSAPPGALPDPVAPLFTEATRDRMELLSERPDPRIDGLVPPDRAEMCICSFYRNEGGEESRSRAYLFNTGCTCDSPPSRSDDEPLRLPSSNWR